MSTFKSYISRDLAAHYGQEAVSIGECGWYMTKSGTKVDIKEALCNAIQKTVSYPPESPFAKTKPGKYDTTIEMINETTLSAARKLITDGYYPVVLNFASATSPGGGFLKEARAQEEYLARSSCLYKCIRSNPMYSHHRRNNDPFYTNYAIYSPGVPVIRDENGELLDKPYVVSIITCPAVNANLLAPERRSEIAPIMFSRILKVLFLGIAHGHDAIVLGAWGCGAFGNDSNEIAHLFHKALFENYRGAYRRVIFAILDRSKERRVIKPFEALFSQK